MNNDARGCWCCNVFVQLAPVLPWLLVNLSLSLSLSSPIPVPVLVDLVFGSAVSISIISIWHFSSVIICLAS